MSLVTSKEIANVLNLGRLGVIGTFLGWIILKSLGISRLNKIYDKHKTKSDLNFLNAILNEVQIEFEIPDEDLKRIPAENAFITVSNHPLGGIDGILLLKLIVQKRNDYKILANFILERIVPLKKYVIPVNPFEDRKNVKSSLGGIKIALAHIKEGKPLGLFPAGEVSTNKDGEIRIDRPWEEGSIKLIKKAKVPVIPIYFHAKNSKLFYFLSNISNSLRTAKLPSELLTQKDRIIKVRIGKPITVKEQSNYKDLSELQRFIRAKTYMLANPFETKKPILSTKSLKPLKIPKRIISPVSSIEIELEINQLDKNKKCLFTSKNYKVYLAGSNHLKNILLEIGRLRELTFREIGEGTNKAYDLDQYDQFYKHMFLWDNQAKTIVGAYRMGLGNDIFQKYGIKGFYINELFKLETELDSMMNSTIEMGRAFIISSYQQKPMPLFLLWKGIIHVTLLFPKHKYLMGGVSISNKFSNFSKSLMIDFMKSNYYDPYLAQYVRPKKEYKVRLKDADKDFVYDKTQADVNKFDKIIDEIEPGNLRLPVLLKKYIKQNAKLVGFNVDPKFNNAVDGLMYLRISDLPESTVNPVLEEIQTELERKMESK